jgi:hypothetical protein
MDSPDAKGSMYEAPALTVYGDITQITRAGVAGSKFDATYQSGADVPFNDNGEPTIFS